MRIGVPREIKNHEYRVAITPAGVHELVGRGHEVVVEHDAGLGSSITDEEYASAGARILDTADGNLVIRAHRDAGRPTSARLTTKGRVEFAYGRLECRAKVAAGKGLWSAFWALGNDIEEAPWPRCGEIDILENVGSQPHRVFGTAHVPGASKEHGLSGELIIDQPFSDRFHTFSVDWEPDSLSWQVDGITYHTLTRGALGQAWRFDHPFYLTLNLAVGGWLGGEPAEDALPSEFLIDYVRWYGPD